MLKKTRTIASSIIAATALTGCASIFGNSDRIVHVTSQPEGADVYYQGNYMGTTPTQVVADSASSPGAIFVEKDGYKSSNVQIESSFQAIGLLNILFWPGFFIDLASGSSMKISESDVFVPLAREE